MAINVYYASPDQTGRNHAGTQADPFSSDDLFGVKNDAYASKLVRPCRVYLLPGNNAYGSPNHNPNTFKVNDNDSSFYFGSNPSNNGFIILEATNRDTATTLIQLPRIAQIKTSYIDDPILISGVYFFGAEALAAGCRMFLDRCVFLHQTDTYNTQLLTCLNTCGSHTTFSGCYFSVQASNIGNASSFYFSLVGYFLFFGCWFDTYFPIEKGSQGAIYDQCVFRNMNPVISGKIAFDSVSSSDIKRCLFWRYDIGVQEEGFQDVNHPEYGEKSRNIIQNCLFYECNQPIIFYAPTGILKSSSPVFGNVYYGALQIYESYLSAIFDGQFMMPLSIPLRKYTGQGIPLGYGRPVMYMNTANPFPQNPNQEQIENSPDEVKAGISAYGLDTFTFPENLVRVGIVDSGKLIRVPLKISPNYLPSPLGVYPAEELVLHGTVAYGAYEELDGKWRTPNNNLVLSPHEYGPIDNPIYGTYVPTTNVRAENRSINFKEPEA